MTGPTRDPLRNAGGLIFPPSTEPARHVPDGRAVAREYGWEGLCLRCLRYIPTSRMHEVCS